MLAEDLYSSEEVTSGNGMSVTCVGIGTIFAFKLIGTFSTRVRRGQFFLLIRMRLWPNSFRSSA
jgi:hypothetical protein